MSGGDHDLIDLVDRIQTRYIHPKQSIAVSNQLDLPFFYFCWMHVCIFTYLTENLCCFIFMKHTLILLPDIEMILSQRQQHRNIFLCNNMPLPKCGILCYVLHNSCNIMTKNMSHGINCVYTFHIASPLLLRCHICLLVYHSYCKLSLFFSVLAFSDISHYNKITGILIPTVVTPKFYDFRGDFP